MKRKKCNKPLGKIELIAIALGGMIGGGIFSILGVSVEMVGAGTPLAIFLGGLLALCAAYSYAKLAIYYKDEGATYSFFKKTFPEREFASSAIGWLIVFGYISTLALYAFTFSSYFATFFNTSFVYLKECIAFFIIFLFALINYSSVKGMGRVEDILVYLKIVILLIISGFFIFEHNQIIDVESYYSGFSIQSLITVASITFVAYEGFQLVIHAYNDADNPQQNVPTAIYWSIGIAIFLYVILSLGALLNIPNDVLIRDKEFALAAGASYTLGKWGYGLIMFGALLATSSAINGTIYGASRLMSVIAEDGVFPKFLSKRDDNHIPKNSILLMCLLSYLFILTGGLQSILEFGSITFIIVSFLMAYSNFKMRNQTQSSPFFSFLAMFFLALAGLYILIFKYQTDMKQLFTIFSIYLVLVLAARFYSNGKHV